MATPSPLHVLIAGGGLSGLALAQGLLKDGHSVEVFERDADLDRKQGYYLHMNALGGEALRRCLPEDLFELYQRTSRENYERHESIVLDDQLRELSSRPHLGPPNEGDRPHTGVHRRTLRQVLAGRLGARLHTSAAVVSYAEDEDGVTVTLVDGSTARGDLLVAADGIRSAVRTQKLPQVPVIPTGIAGIGVYGRTILTPELQQAMPQVLHHGVLMAIDRKGSRLLIGEYLPRQPAAEAAGEVAPDVVVDTVPPYLMVSCSVSPGTVVPPLGDWTADTPRQLRDSMLRALDGWHPVARDIVGAMEPDSMFAIPFGYLEPADDWQSSRVTLVGDAAHGMLPTMGMGANLALHDAATLVDALRDLGSGGDRTVLTQAVGDYERHMRETAYPILRMTLDHDRNFGGGALAEASGGTGVA
jgi:2-polyprenyl-6-methoxyphenol hydroxylase-like FAD-dependent oxidoreductase